MNFRRGRTKEYPYIDLIPLIDILIVILIFLFLTTTYNRFAELQINLPEASAERAADKPSMLSIAVDAGFHNTVLPMSAGAVGRLPPMAVKLNGVTAYTNPSSGR